MDPIIRFWDAFGKKCVTFICQAFGQHTQFLFIRLTLRLQSKADEEFGAWSDNIWLALCKH